MISWLDLRHTSLFERDGNFLAAAFVTEERLSVKINAIRHSAFAAKIANLITLQRVNCNHTEHQAVLALKQVDLVGNAIPDEIEYMSRVKIFGKTPGVRVTRKISSAAVPQDNMDRVTLVHGMIVYEHHGHAKSEREPRRD